MKSLRYFEQEALQLIKENIDFSLIRFDQLVLSLMKKYRKEHDVEWMKYKKVYDKWFKKYHE